jgi:hypothetical protein
LGLKFASFDPESWMALQHFSTELASIRKIRKSLSLLRPGGTAVHTTERLAPFSDLSPMKKLHLIPVGNPDARLLEWLR